jgi:hypothetical protein
MTATTPQHAHLAAQTSESSRATRAALCEALDVPAIGEPVEDPPHDPFAPSTLGPRALVRADPQDP